MRGRVVVAAARLTDLLTSNPTLTFREARATVLRDGRQISVPEIEIVRGELVAITMAGPRGDPSRRVRRPDHPLLAMRGGPYRIWGRAHMPPAVDPTLFARRRGPLLPLTEVVLAYELDGATVHEGLPGLIVNLELIELMADADLRSIEGASEALNGSWAAGRIGDTDPIMAGNAADDQSQEHEWASQKPGDITLVGRTNASPRDPLLALLPEPPEAFTCLPPDEQAWRGRLFLVLHGAGDTAEEAWSTVLQSDDVASMRQLRETMAQVSDEMIPGMIEGRIRFTAEIATHPDAAGRVMPPADREPR